MPRYKARFSSTDTELGKRVRARAIAKDMTMREVCAQLGISESTLSRAMAGVFATGTALAKVRRFADGNK